MWPTHMDVPELDGVIAAGSYQETRDMAAQAQVCEVGGGGGGGGQAQVYSFEHKVGVCF